MTNTIKKMSTIILSTLCVSSNNMVFAENIYGNIKTEALNYHIKTELERFIKENNIHVKIDDINFKLKEENTKDIESKINQDIEYLKESLLKTKMSVSESEMQPYLVNKGSYYTAKVFSGIPSLGVGHIQQDFKATISNGKISKVSLLGNSYQTGILYAKWNPTRSWTTLSKSNKHLAIRMKGVLNYTLNIFEGGYSATFVEDVKVSGSKLVECYECD